MQKREMICLKKKLLFSSMIHIFFAVTLILFGPYEIFISNSNDFNFTFCDFWWMPVIVAAIYILIATCICVIIPKCIADTIHLLTFSFTLCCYIQALFLNGKMVVLVGKDIHWTVMNKITNAGIWLFICSGVLILNFFCKDKWKKILLFLAMSLTAMQLAAFCFLLITTDTLTEEKTGYLSQKGMLELSRGRNVIVFILDYFDGRFMEAILEENPDILQPLDGFTYFPNATSVHSRTYPSIPYLLTGEQCYFDKNPLTYINQAYEDSEFLSTLYANDVNMGIYTYGNFIGASAKAKIYNYVPARLPLKFVTTMKYLAKMILYRDMPYLIKNLFYYDASEVNNNVTGSISIRNVLEATQNVNVISEYKNFDDEWFDNTLTQDKISLVDNDAAFRFYHLGSCHLNLSDALPAGIRSLEIVYDYIEQMRELGIYEDATIIIMADHGSSGGGDTLDLPQQTAVPLFIVKPAGISNQPIRISNAPVSHTDFRATAYEGFSLDYSGIGQSVFDIDEKAQRDRYYYYSALYSDEAGEVELREYKIEGDARDGANYDFTGKRWEILYSTNIVAK